MNIFLGFSDSESNLSNGVGMYERKDGESHPPSTLEKVGEMEQRRGPAHAGKNIIHNFYFHWKSHGIGVRSNKLKLNSLHWDTLQLVSSLGFAR